MSEHQLEVILKMRDEASKKIEQFSQKVENEMKRAGDAMASMGKQLSTVSRNMAFLGTAIVGPLGIAFKTASNYSIEVNDSLTRLENSTVALQNTIATAMVPVVDKLNESMWKAVKMFESLDPKMRDTVIQGALTAGIFLLMGSAILKTVSAIEILVGKILIFGAAGITINPVALAFIAVAGAIALIIANVDKIRSAATRLYSIFDAIKDRIVNFLPKIVDTAEGVTNNFLQSIGLPSLPMFDIVFDKIKELGKQIDELNAKKMMGAGIQSGIDAFLGGFLPGLGNAADAIKSLMPQGGVDLGKIEVQSPLSKLDMELEKFSQNFSKVWTQAYEQAVNLGQQSAQIFVSSIQQLSSGIGNAVSDMIFKGKNFGESMKQVALQMAQTFVASIVQMITQFLIFQATQAAFFPLIVAMGGAAAAALGAMWAPVAAMVSLATMGANAGPAAAAIASTMALARASAIPMAGGGSGTVRRPTLFLAGEAGPERYSFEPLNRINNQGRSSGNTTINHFNIEINGPVIRDETDIETLAAEIDRRIARGTSR